MRIALSAVLLFASAAAAQAERNTSYLRDDRIRIPFDLRNAGGATRIVLYYSFDGGEWREHDSARAGARREFIFRADREGTYGFATMTHFTDGPSDPPRKDQLKEQRRVVYDRTPPRVMSLRANLNAENAPGAEWDVADDHMDPKGVRLEFRWDGAGDYKPIDRDVPFRPRDSRFWQLKATDRMQVRIVATDRAGNRTESDPVWVSMKDAERGDGPAPRAPAAGVSSTRDADVTQTGGSRTAPPNLHYVKEQTVALNISATVGASGLKDAVLYVTDSSLQNWKIAQRLGAKQAIKAGDGYEVPLQFVAKVEKDGLYHFMTVYENHLGPNRRAPKPGDAGDVQVMVDTTPPAVVIESTRVSSNGDRGAVVNLRWKATDPNLAPVPIKLEYAPVTNKPGEQPVWTAITDGFIDNSGQHAWPVPTGEAYEYLVRVIAKDRAGNETRKPADKPVNVDLTVPSSKDVQVAPSRGGLANPIDNRPVGNSGNFDVSGIPSPPK